MDGVRFPEGLNYEDHATMPQAIGECSKVAFVDTYTYYYRANSSSISSPSSLFPEGYKHLYKAYEIADDYIGGKYPALMKHMHIRYIRDSINFLYMASPLKDKYPEVIKDISGRLHVKDIPGYIFGPSGWKSKAAMVFAALTPALAVKVFALIQKQH